MKTFNNDIEPSNWVNKYSEILYHYANARVNDKDLANDLVQETFLSALRGLEGFEARSTVKTWLFSILKRKIIDAARRERVRKTKNFSALTKGYATEESFFEKFQKKNILNETEEKIERSEMTVTIAVCIDSLPNKWKGIFVDKVLREKDTDTVCNIHNVTRSNLWVIIHRSKLKLRQCINYSNLKQ